MTIEVPTLTPATSVLLLSETVLRSAEMALIRLNLGQQHLLLILTMIISFTFNDPNVLPACYVNTLDPLILTSSPSPILLLLLV